jgi:CBS domain-containing protein
VDENTTVEAAAQLMIDAGVSSLIIRPTARDDPYGIVTMRDIVNGLAEGVNPGETRVGAIASTPLIVVTPGVPLNYIARLMKRASLRHIVVFNGREVVGVVSNVDIVRAVAKGQFAPRVPTEAQGSREVITEA